MNIKKSLKLNLLLFSFFIIFLNELDFLTKRGLKTHKKSIQYFRIPLKKWEESEKIQKED